MDSVSVIYFAGKIRKAVYVEGITKPHYYQGFGTLEGLVFFNNDCMSDCVLSINCYSQNITILYQARDCYVNYEEIEEPDLPIEKFTIFPNLLVDYINISNVPERIEYRIFDINGRVIKKDFIINENNTIPFPYPNGLYIIELKYENWKVIKTEKIVKLSL